MMPRAVPGLALSLGLSLLALVACGPGSQPSPAAATVVGTPAAAAAAATKPAGQTPAAATTPAAAAAASAAPAAAASASPLAAASPSAVGAPAAPAASIAGPFPGEAKNLTGAGATFPGPLYAKWFDAYQKVTQVQVNYQAIGSGGGIKGIQDQTIDFGASDAPMTDEQLAAAKGGEIYHVPTALGAIVISYNVPEAKDKLKFTGDTIAGIYTGDIAKWNDSKLVADNPDLANVNKDIVTVHRSDGSGTTFGFTDYLSTVNADWKSRVGKGTSVNWPGGLGGSGNPGVAGEVQQTPYAVGYIELIYAAQNKISYGLVKNKAGKFVDPSLDSVTAAAASSANAVPADLRFSIVDAPGDAAYSISTATWLLTYKNMTDQAKGLALTRMLWWATHEGQQLNKDVLYATVPPELTTKSEQFIKQITVEGKPVFPGK